MAETEEKTQGTQGRVKINQNNLYQQETFTDLRIGTIYRFTPVKPNGEMDKGRKTIFAGNTQIMTQQGPFPVQFPIEANNLQQAITAFPEALDEMLKTLAEEAREIQRQEESRIIVPSAPAGEGLIHLK
ncbi:MAG: hypothetical protein JW950_12905 [Deltaproteobacteria bacterium]|nr:hypothetical protein [Deltaproteobacteria bacterium]